MWLSGKESACQCRIPTRHGFHPWSWKWQPTPVFLPRKSHGQRSLAGYSLWGHKESNTTKHTCTHAPHPATQTDIFATHPWKCEAWYIFLKKQMLILASYLDKALEIQSSTTKKTIFFIASSNFSNLCNGDNSSQFFLHIPVLYNILGDRYSFRSIVLLKIISFQYILLRLY